MELSIYSMNIRFVSLYRLAMEFNIFGDMWTCVAIKFGFYNLNSFIFGKLNFAFASLMRRSTSEKILFTSSSVYSYALLLAQLLSTLILLITALVRCTPSRLNLSRFSSCFMLYVTGYSIAYRLSILM